MRPTLPDSPTLKALRDTPPEDRAAEVERAKQFVQAAQLYLNWAEMGQQLAYVFDLIAGGKDGQQILIDAKTGSGSPVAMGEITQTIYSYANRPSLRKAILTVMAEDPNRVWKKAEIMAQLRNYGWEPKGGKPSSQLATRLAEMIERGEVRRVSVGHYALDLPEGLPEAPG